MIRVENLVGGYAHTKIIKGLHLEIRKGEFFALLGPNGSGKTTLFKLITGQLPIQAGVIKLAGKELSTLTKLEKAKKVAVLSQEVNVSFDYTVEEIISLGRYPHQKGLLKSHSKHDWEVIEHVMKVTKVEQFRKTQFRLISGGEKQRVLLAKALAQEPEALLLDEPTNHLDIKHTFQMLDLLKEWQQTKGLTIFAILHDLNVASLYADRIALLHEGSFLEVGDVNTLRKEDQLKKVYEVDVKTQSHPTVPKPQLLMTPNYQAPSRIIPFHKSYTIDQTRDYLHIQFEQPLRAMSNGVIGEGIQWLEHFIYYQGQKNANKIALKKDLLIWMKKYHIPPEQSAGMITAEEFEDIVIHKQRIGKTEFMVLVKAETGHGSRSDSSLIRVIQTMVFIDGYLTDGALIDGYMAATEAKMRAIEDLNMAMVVTDTSNDCLVLAVRQQGEPSPDARFDVRKGIERVVYGATQEAVSKCARKPVQQS